MNGFEAEYNKAISEIKTAIPGALNFEAATELKNVTREKVYERVYAEYDNQEYLRRGDEDGLSDTDTYIVSVTGNELTLEVGTTGNENYADSEGWDSGQIADIVESGDGYNWTHSKIYREQPFPRPFLNEALEQGINDLSLDAALAEGMKRQGFDATSAGTRLHTPQRSYPNPNAYGYMNSKEAETARRYDPDYAFDEQD